MFIALRLLTLSLLGLLIGSSQAVAQGDDSSCVALKRLAVLEGEELASDLILYSQILKAQDAQRFQLEGFNDDLVTLPASDDPSDRGKGQVPQGESELERSRRDFILSLQYPFFSNLCSRAGATCP